MPPTLAQFHAVLESVSANPAQWFNAINAIKIEELPVSYAVGKQFERNKYIVTEDLKMALLFANRADKDRSLVAEVSFLTSIQELQSQMQQFVSL